MKVQLTEDQSMILDKMKEWFNNYNGEPFELCGYKGTGKNLIINRMRGELNIDNVKSVCFLNISTRIYDTNLTIRKLIYNGFNLNNSIGDTKLIIIQDAYNVPAKVKSDLESFNIPIIALCNRPLSNYKFNTEGYFTKQSYELTEIHRQEEK